MSLTSPLLGLALTACGSEAHEVPVSPPAPVRQPLLVPVRSKLLVPRSELNASLVLTPDLAHHARVRTQTDGSWEVIHDGRPVASGLGGVLDGTPVLLSGGQRVAWGERSGQGWRVVVAGQATAAFAALGKVGIAVSTDGEHLAWQGQVDGGWQVLLDGEAVGTWADVGPPVLSPSGGHLAFAAQGTEGQVLVRDGHATPLSGTPIAAAFSASGDVLTLVVQRSDGFWSVRNGVDDGPFADLGSPVHAPRGDRWALPQQVEGRWDVRVDGVSGVQHERVGHPGPQFDPSGQHVAWWAQDDGVLRVYRDGKPGRPQGGVGDLPLVWSADGEHLAWLGRTPEETGDRSWHVVVDDVPFLAREQVAQVALSSDGAFVAWVGREGDGWAVRLGRTRDGEISSTDLVEGVGTDFGGGIAFAEGILRYTTIDGLGLVVNEVEIF